ncbi:MAG: fumarylacetoacetate hydrolase family protein [Elusimicrobiota bacterium]
MPDKFARFKDKEDNIRWGVVVNRTIEIIDGTPFGDFTKTGIKKELPEINLVAPVKPKKIICVGLNYRDHARELNMDLPESPLIFLKASSSYTGPNSDIIKPPACRQLDYEAELAAVVGKQGKNIAVEEAGNFVLGYTCFNDVTARDIQQRESQWSRAKGYDTFSPTGPVIATGISTNSLDIKLYLNGNLKQNSNTENMIFSVPEIVSFVSEIMTLYPGDIIATGTPPGVGPMEPGDRVEIEIEHIGNLKNTVRKEK